MTQIPGSSWCRSAARVSPESAPAPVEPSADRTDGRMESPVPDDLHNALALAIYRSGVALGAAGAAAEAICAAPKLLDALVAYRQSQRVPVGYIVCSTATFLAPQKIQNTLVTFSLDKAREELERRNERAEATPHWHKGSLNFIGEIYPMREAKEEPNA